MKRRKLYRPLLVDQLESRINLSTAPAWTSIGPTSITDPYQQNLNYNNTTYVEPAAMTGAVQSIATYTTPQGTVGAYIGGALGGVWQTQNIFASTPVWTTGTDNMPSLAIDTLGISPLDPSGATVFAGTGPTSNGGVSWSGYGNYPDTSALATGIYLTTNGGQSWTALNGPSSPIYGKFISKVLPTAVGTSVANQTLLVGTASGLFVSNDGGQTFAAQTFTNPVLDVIADPNTAGRYYLLAGPKGGASTAGVYESNDNGVTWSSINNGAIDSTVLDLMPTIGLNNIGNGAGRLAATTQGGNTLLYMTFGTNTNHATYGVFSTPITAAGASNWSLYYQFPGSPDGGGNNLGLAIDPSNPQIVYTGGYGGNHGYCLAPVAGTVQATELTNENKGSLYDLRNMTFAWNAGTSVLLTTTDSGVYALANPSIAPTLPTWTPVMSNASVNESYSITAMAGTNGQLYVAGGAQDTASFQASISPTGSVSPWVMINGGDGFGSAYDQSAGMVYTSADNLTGMQVSLAGANTIQTTTFSGFATEDGGSVFPSIIAVSNVAGVTGTPNPVVVSGYGLYQAQPNSLTSGDVKFTMINATDKANDTYSALSYGGFYQGSADPNILYAARGDGTLWFSDTFGAQVTQLTSWKYGTIVGLQQNPTNSHMVYALTRSNLYVTQDAGQTWTQFATQPPSSSLGSFQSLGLVPTTLGSTATNLLLVGGSAGVLMLPDNPALGVTSWIAAESNIPNTIVTDFAYVPSLDTLLLSTFGRGDWLLPNASTQLLYAVSTPTATQLTAPGTAVVGQAVNLAALVSNVGAGLPTPTGSVNFYAVTSGGNVLLGSSALNATGTATYVAQAGVPFGATAILATYSGDSTHAGSQAQSPLTVSAQTTTQLTAPGTAVVGQPVNLAAIVSNVGAGIPTPTGTVTFTAQTPNGEVLLGSSTLDATGNATYVAQAGVPFGATAILATYSGDSTHAGSQAQSAITVTAAATTTTLSAPASATASSPITLVAQVSTGNGGVPTGLVVFQDGATVLGSAPVGANGVASFIATGLAVGTHQLTAVYQPSAGSPFQGSATATAQTVQITPDPATSVATTTNLSGFQISTSHCCCHGSKVLYVTRVTAANGAPVTGQVQLTYHGKVLSVRSLDANSQSKVVLAQKGLNPTQVVAVFLGGQAGLVTALPSHSYPRSKVTTTATSTGAGALAVSPAPARTTSTLPTAIHKVTAVVPKPSSFKMVPLPRVSVGS